MAGVQLCSQAELPGSAAPDYLDQFPNWLDAGLIRGARAAAQEKIRLPFWQPHREVISSLPQLSPVVDLSAHEVTVGRSEDLNAGQLEQLREAIELLIPWRKGPWNLFGEKIDSEWRSDLKWDRVAPLLGSLENRKVADIGCGNGYYMFRLASLGPSLVLGMDPSDRFFYQFQFVQHFAQTSCLYFEPFGVEHATLYPNFFDAVLCMGVIYHRADPLGMLRDLHQCMMPDGELILESQAIPGDDDIALFPRERYAKARNVYFVPTANCLLNMVRRAGFVNAEICSFEKVTTDEQRKTKHARFESLEDFLDASDPSLTVEGYPAPYRVIVKAVKQKK